MDDWAEFRKQYSDSKSQVSGDDWEDFRNQYRPPQVSEIPVPPGATPPIVPQGSDAKNFAMGAGRGGRDLIDGPAYLLPKSLGYVTGLGGYAPNRVSDFFDKEAKRVSEINRAAESEYQSKTPGSVAAGTGRVLTNLASGAIPFFGQAGKGQQATKGAQYLESALKGGLLGGVFGTKTEDDSFFKNAALGGSIGLLGQTVANGLKSLVNPSGASNVRDGLVQVAKQEGIPLNAAQASNSPFLKAVDGALDYLPFTSGKQQAFKENQAAKFTDALARKMGTTGPLTPQAVGQARQAAGRAVGDITRQYDMSPQATNNLVSELANLQGRYQLATSDTQKALQSSIDEVLGKIQNNQMKGEAYRNLHSFLGKQQVSGDPAKAVSDVRKTLSNAMFSSAPKSFQDALEKARSEYQAVMTLAPAAARSVDGMISPNAVLQAVNSGVKNAKFGARSDLADLGRVGKMIAPMANSGTQPRQMAQGLLTGNWIADGTNIPGLSQASGLLGIPVQALMNSPLGVAMVTKGAGGLPMVGPALRQTQPVVSGLLSGGAPGMMGPRPVDYLFSN